MGSGLTRDVLKRNARAMHVGLLEGRERLDALAAADVVVYPSSDEVFGLVPLEALLCGSPVIVCNDSGAGEIIGTVGGGHIVPVDDDDSLAGAIESMLAANGLWRAAGPAWPAASVRQLFDADVDVRAPRRGLSTRSRLQRRRGSTLGMNPHSAGVSFVMPVYNGRRWLREALDCDRRPARRPTVRESSPSTTAAATDRGGFWRTRFEPDGSHSSTAPAAASPPRSTRASAKRGTPIICQVDQDVILAPGWLAHLLEALDEPSVAAAQGHYHTAPDAGFWARMMGRDLEQRYRRIRGDEVDHVCTGNTAYRASALHQVGLLDETLGYGSDNDLSYRLTAAGHRLVFCRDAVSLHRLA